jgi:hypothetical protein
MELHKLHMLVHPPELPNGPATYTLMIARESGPSGSVQSASFPSWDSLARKLASVGVGEGELQKAKRELDKSLLQNYGSVPVTCPNRTTRLHPETSSVAALIGRPSQ